MKSIPRFSQPDLIRRFEAGESAAEIAASKGMSRNRVLDVIRTKVCDVCPEARLTAFGPVTEKRARKILAA